jgi:protein arginine kinase
LVALPVQVSNQLEDLNDRCGEWLRGTGPEADIVISSRVRLARNLAEYPFIRRCTADDRLSIERTMRTKLESIPQWDAVRFVDVASLSEVDRQFLVERQMISRELSEAEGARAVAMDSSLERFSVMINEEDHLRLQVMVSGLDLMAAWERIAALDDLVGERVTYAFHPKYGFLTACPTNAGTGVRVSVMLHLPALVITRQIDKVFRGLQKISVTVRGLYGEGSQYMGDFYQVSNQITLGCSEVELVQKVGEVIPSLIDYERRARAFLLKENKQDLHDDVSRAMGILCTAKKISSEETMHYLSKVRMGVNLGLIGDLPITVINKLFIHTQPAHLQKLRGRLLGSADRNVERASYLQRFLSPNVGGAERN